jgi:predicted RecB family nuclease
VGNITEFENLESDLLKKNRKEYFDRICSKYREDQILRKFDFKKKKQIKNKCYYIEPLLIRKQFNIRFDALEIIPDKSFPNKISYIPISVSPKEKVLKTEKLSLSIKHLILMEFYNFTPEHGRIIYGKDLKSTRIAFKTYEKESRKLLKELTKIINNDDAPIFYKNDHCQICEFQKDCRKILVEKDDLSLLGRMSQKEIIKQNNKGIFTVNQFSYLYKPKKYNKKDSKEPQRPEYSLKALALREGKTYILKLPKLNSSKVEIYLDIEGLPDENFCYLIGLVIQNENEKRLSFWADSKEDEKKIFMQLLETVSKFDDFIIYHYGNYEIHFLNKINKKLDNAYDDEIRLIMEKSINILSLFTTAIYPPTYTNELKEIAPFLGFKWSNKNASGIQSIIWRKKWELYDNPEYRSDLVQYNIEDCLALKLIKEWIVAIIKNSNQQDKKEDFVNVEDMKIQGVFRFGNKNYQTPDFELITKCAYFDYQREKIYLKTNKTIKRALKRREKRKKQIDKINKIIETSPKRCPNCRFNQFNEIKRSKRSKIEVNLKFINNGIKKWVTQYNGGSFICKKCRKIFTPHDFKQIHNYGHNLIIWSANQYITHRVSFRRIAEMLQESFNIQAIYSRVFDFKVILAREYKQTYEHRFSCV